MCVSAPAQSRRARCALLPNLDPLPKHTKRPTRWADRLVCECTCPDLNWGPPPCQGGALTGLRYRCVVVLAFALLGRTVSRLAARWRRDLNPCRRLCRPLPRLSATPPRFWGFLLNKRGPSEFRADDGIRTRDPHLGKVMRYQLRHIRIASRLAAAHRVARMNISRRRSRFTNRAPDTACHLGLCAPAAASRPRRVQGAGSASGAGPAPSARSPPHARWGRIGQPDRP